MGFHRVLFLLYLNIALSWPKDGRLRPKHVVQYNLIVIIASCLDVCCVLTVHNILYNLIYTAGWPLSNLKTEAYPHRKVSRACTYVSAYFHNLQRFSCQNIPKSIASTTYGKSFSNTIISNIKYILATIGSLFPSFNLIWSLLYLTRRVQHLGTTFLRLIFKFTGPCIILIVE